MVYLFHFDFTKINVIFLPSIFLPNYLELILFVFMLFLYSPQST